MPGLLADHGIPSKPQDLTHHRCCNIRLPTSGGLYAWEFERDGRKVTRREPLLRTPEGSFCRRLHQACRGRGTATRQLNIEAGNIARNPMPFIRSPRPMVTRAWPTSYLKQNDIWRPWNPETRIL
jgi:hypothetical protein